MRSYKAARRAHTGDPVPFRYEYTDDDGVEQVEVFECQGEVSSLLLSELASNADVDVATPEGVALLREFFAQAFGDEAAYRRFFKLHTKYGDDDLLMDIMAGLVEDFAGRPTRRPSASPATQSSGGMQSKVVSLQQGTVEVRQAPIADDAVRTLTAYSG